MAKIGVRPTAADLGLSLGMVQRAVQRHRQAAQGAAGPQGAVPAAPAQPAYALPPGPLDPVAVQELAIRELLRAMSLETNAARLGTLTSQFTLAVGRLEAMREKRQPEQVRARLVFYVPTRAA